MYNSYIKKFAALTLFFILGVALSPSTTTAQGNFNLPYSIYGVGELRFGEYFQNMRMGGISQAYSSNVSINDINPASYAALDSTSFVFEATLFSHFLEQETAVARQRSDFISLGNISFGFPVTRWWSFAAGLKPYSSLGYSIRDREDHPQAGTVTYFYEGSGGLNQLFIGSAFKPFGGLSAGFNASYVFGGLDYEASVVSNVLGVYQTNLTSAHQVNGWMFGFGMQYRHDISEQQHITFGATFGNQQDLDISSTETLKRRLTSEMLYDTISFVEAEKAVMSMPMYYGFGVFGRLNNNWSAGLDYKWQNWEEFEFPGRGGNYNNSYQVSAGVEFAPTIETFATFFHRLRYSAGLRYGQAYFMPGGEPLDEFGISFGTSIPIRGSLSGLNLNFEYSRRGSEDVHMIQENFYRINIGINIYENWFIRRRFY